MNARGCVYWIIFIETCALDYTNYAVCITHIFNLHRKALTEGYCKTLLILSICMSVSMSVSPSMCPLVRVIMCAC